MTKTKFKIDLLAFSNETENLCNMLSRHNGGEVPLCLDDLVSYSQTRKALLPSSRADFSILTDEGDNSRVIVREGDKVVMTIEEIELHELNEDNGHGAMAD